MYLIYHMFFTYMPIDADFNNKYYILYFKNYKPYHIYLTIKKVMPNNPVKFSHRSCNRGSVNIWAVI